MAKDKNASFITELPLQTNDRQERVLLVRMDAARQVYNACLGESLKRLKLMRESKQYQAVRKMRSGKRRTAEFADARTRFGFREYDLHAYAKQFSHSWLGDHLDSNTVQKLASRAFATTMRYAIGRGGKPRFKGKHQLVSVEGKTNASGIRWRDDCHVAWLGLRLEAAIPANDAVIQHGLEARVKYVRLLTRQVHGKTRFYAQLICEGVPYQKPKNYLGEGRVGLDIGPSTIAIASEGEARLVQFCDELAFSQRKIRRLQRKMDRSKRANNPQNYNPNGTIKKGAKKWIKSKRYRKVQYQKAEIERQQAAYRKSLHGQLVNDILRMGNVVNLEKLSYKAFQRRFGKSIGKRAPGMFVAMLRRKAESAGGVVNEYSTYHTRHSQLCHGCGTIEKKPLSQRWHVCDCGIVAQRDLYSAFLAMCMEGNAFNADYARSAWSGADTRLQAALRDAQLASGGHTPVSFGLNRRQSQSPAIPGEEVCETQVVVPNQNIGWREPARASSTSRTPRL